MALKKIEEIMLPNFPKLMKNMNVHIRDQGTSSRIKIKEIHPTLLHVIIKLSKAKDQKEILKVAREKRLNVYKRVSIRLTPYFSS